MKWREFKAKYQNHLIIDSRSIGLSENPDYLRIQISNWKKQNYLLELKRGNYVINEPFYLERISPLYIANQIYSPSYISLEYALSFYGLIPEGVYTYTSVSTKKTASFQNHFGNYSYQSISTKLFWGFDEMKIKNQSVFFATKEKAILDFIYYRLAEFKEKPSDFTEGFRFQNLEELNPNQLTTYAQSFSNTKLQRIVELFAKGTQSC